jgi:hypothetical protein
VDLIQLTDIGTEDRLMGACCTLEAAEMPARLKEWSDLRDRSIGIKPIEGGVSITLPTSEPMSQVADLIAREAECCPFYTFTLRIDGPARELQITAGEGREIAVQAMLGVAPPDRSQRGCKARRLLCDPLACAPRPS